MGNLNQAVWNTARGNWFHLTNQPGTVNRLSLHVEPILIPISWLYWIYSGPPTLLVLQAVIVALGAIPTYALARHKSFGPWPALAFAAAFLLNPSLQAANWLEFHPVTLAPTFLIAAFYFLVTGRTGWFAVFAVLAASCKEEIALLVFMMGLYAAIALSRPRLGIADHDAVGRVGLHRRVRHPERFRRRQHPLEPLRLSGRHACADGRLPCSPSRAWSSSNCAQRTHSRYLVQIVLPLAFMPLLALDILVLALPSFALNLLADFSPMHQVYTLIYAAPIVPFAVMASIYGAHRLVVWSGRDAARDGSLLARTPGAGRGHRRIRLRADVQPALRLHPRRRQLHALHGDRTRPPRRPHSSTRFPPDAKVSAQDRLDPHVSGRETIYIFPRIEDADTVFVDVTGPAWPQHPSDLRNAVDELLDCWLWHRRGGRRLLCCCAAARAPPTCPPRSTPPGDARATRRQSAAGRLRRCASARRLCRCAPTTTARQSSISTGRRCARWTKTTASTWPSATAPATRCMTRSIIRRLPYCGILRPSGSPARPCWCRRCPGRVDDEPSSPSWSGVYAGEDGWLGSGRLPVANNEPLAPRVGKRYACCAWAVLNAPSSGDWQPLAQEEAEPQCPIQARFGDAIELEGANVAVAERRAEVTHLPSPYSGVRWTSQTWTTPPLRICWTRTASKSPSTTGSRRDAAGPSSGVDMACSTSARGSRRAIALPEHLEPGVYRIIVGMYDWQNGERLAGDRCGRGRGDVVTIASVEIE